MASFRGKIWCWFYPIIFIFCQKYVNRTELSTGAQETFIHRFVMRNPSYDAKNILATFDGEIGVASTRTSNGLEPPNPTKSYPLGGLFGSTAISK